MTKIAIISQAEQGVLIDISGCSSLQEAKQYLNSTLQVSSQFWEGLVVDLNLGPLVLTAEQVNEISAIVSGVGVQPRQIFSLSPITRASLLQCRLPLGMHGDLHLVTGVTAAEPSANVQNVDMLEVPLTNPINNPIASTLANPLIDPGAEITSTGGFPQVTEYLRDASEDLMHVHSASTLASARAASAQPLLQPASPAAANSSKGSSSISELFLKARSSQEDTPASPAAANGRGQNTASSVSLPVESPSSIENYELQVELQRILAQHEASKNAFLIADTSLPIVAVDLQAAAADASEQTVQTSQKQPLHANKPAANALPPRPPQVLLMKQTLRSGQRVSHKGHLVIIGDVNPGAELVAEGDITVWGALRGIAHAGASGNTSAEIRALKFEPIQLRIAQCIARSPDRHKSKGNAAGGPETARVVDGKIRIVGSEPE